MVGHKLNDELVESARVACVHDAIVSFEHGYDTLVTIDCDGQHQPQRIPEFVAASASADIVSGSRYLKQFEGDSRPPENRRRINQQITEEINHRLGLALTDAFCGFKAYRVDALPRLNITEFGYAMPLQLWVQAARAGFRIVEHPVPLIYLDEKRSFGGSLDDAVRRMAGRLRPLATGGLVAAGWLLAGTMFGRCRVLLLQLLFLSG